MAAALFEGRDMSKYSQSLTEGDVAGAGSGLSSQLVVVSEVLLAFNTVLILAKYTRKWMSFHLYSQRPSPTTA
jgi:hypothetical protein